MFPMYNMLSFICKSYLKNNSKSRIMRKDDVNVKNRLRRTIY